MSDDQITTILTYLLIFMGCVLITLTVVFIMVKAKDNKKKQAEKAKELAITTDNGISQNTATRGYSKQSIFNFMEFDKIEDNMIVQKNGNKYLMVIECQGVNYDLMSDMEQTAVEEGFIGFLNSLRYPIQIYVQTRTVNLEGSLSNYNKKVNEIEAELRRREADYEANVQSGMFTNEELGAQFYELTKFRNLYEYGKDIIFNTEQMSLNKNVLNKKYYIITSYYPADMTNSNFDKEELKNIAFAELYTRSQAIIASLSSSGVVGKILGSNSLAELLYMAYNRDEAEIYGLDKALAAGYDELYTTAPDVLDKKIAALDREIQTKAMDTAQEAVGRVRTTRERKYEERKMNMDDIIDEMAKAIIQENEEYIGKEVAEESIEEIKNTRGREESSKKTEEGGKVDEQKKTRRVRRTAKRA